MSDSGLAAIGRLLEHMLWADRRVRESLREAGEGHDEARALYAHVLGAEQVWLARLEGESAGPVWPDPDATDLDALRTSVATSYSTYVQSLTPSDLTREVRYVNSAGRSFASRIDDILLHVFHHGSYHRGQVALLLRRHHARPRPTDYIAHARGAPAATRADSAGTPARRGLSDDGPQGSG